MVHCWEKNWSPDSPFLIRSPVSKAWPECAHHLCLASGSGSQGAFWQAKTCVPRFLGGKGTGYIWLLATSEEISKRLWTWGLSFQVRTLIRSMLTTLLVNTVPFCMSKLPQVWDAAGLDQTWLIMTLYHILIKILAVYQKYPDYYQTILGISDMNRNDQFQWEQHYPQFWLVQKCVESRSVPCGRVGVRSPCAPFAERGAAELWGMQLGVLTMAPLTMGVNHGIWSPRSWIFDMITMDIYIYWYITIYIYNL